MKLNKIKLGKKIISKEKPPYIIAEIGVNHEGSLTMAKKLIYLAKKGGADAAKFQTYKAHLITSKFAKSYWDTKKEKTKSQFELFKKYDLFERKHYKELSNYCKKIKIEFISTPFDIKAVDMLDDLVKFYKISSSDITNFPLLKKVASKKKPIILSTGASTLKEIKKALNFLKKNNCKQIVLLHCILNYPTINSEANLNMITSLEKNFPNHIIGYSDHTLPSKDMKNITTAYLLGARVIEKHFTINKKLIGNDHYHSMDFKDLKNLNYEIKNLRNIIGNKEKNFLKSEKKSRKFARRSVVAKNYIKKNQIIKLSDLICKRPGTGLEPSKINFIVGKKAVRNLVEDHIIAKRDIK
jgi:sialic acid synthase SpsE